MEKQETTIKLSSFFENLESTTRLSTIVAPLNFPVHKNATGQTVNNGLSSDASSCPKSEHAIQCKYISFIYKLIQNQCNSF